MSLQSPDHAILIAKATEKKKKTYFTGKTDPSFPFWQIFLS